MALGSLVTVIRFGQFINSSSGVHWLCYGQSYCPSKGQGSTGECRDPMVSTLSGPESYCLFSFWAGPASFDDASQAIPARRASLSVRLCCFEEDKETG